MPFNRSKSSSAISGMKGRKVFKRASSLPINLPDAADDFMVHTVLNVPQNPQDSSSTSLSEEQVREQQQQHYQSMALVQLEQFFLGSATTAILPLPVVEETPAVDAEAAAIEASNRNRRRFLNNRSNTFPMDCSQSERLPLKSSLKRKNGPRVPKLGDFDDRMVCFSKLSIREYPVAPSDHPGCSHGPPVQLSWEHSGEQEHELEEYEEERMGTRKRGLEELVLSYYDRRALLLKDQGYSKKEVLAAMRESQRVKRERKMTDLFMPTQGIDETMENVVDTIKRFFSKPEPLGPTA